MKKAIFLDRDGTINIDKHYVYKIEDFIFIPGIKEAIKRWNNLGYLVIVITNQSGIARGYYKESDVSKLHNYIDKELKKVNAHIDAYYYCPHHKDGIVKKYAIDCNCRKPKTGMLEKAIKDYDIDVTKSFLFGDKDKDIDAGEKMHIKSFMVNGNNFDINDYKRYFI